jgi:hypothetical protein
MCYVTIGSRHPVAHGPPAGSEHARIEMDQYERFVLIMATIYIQDRSGLFAFLRLARFSHVRGQEFESPHLHHELKARLAIFAFFTARQ